ncbi:MAG: hypothetical protein WA990_13965 [Rubrobacteraceae bacterium]
MQEEKSIFALVCPRCNRALFHVEGNVLVMNSTLIEWPESKGSGFDVECWSCREVTTVIDGAKLHMRGLEIYTTSQRPGDKPAFLVRNPGPTDDDIMRRIDE